MLHSDYGVRFDVKALNAVGRKRAATRSHASNSSTKLPMASSTDRIVDFFIIGVQKGGTTALDLHLRQLPGIQMARQKEIHYFDDESLDWSMPTNDRLHAAFEWPAFSLTIRGEATPIYSYWPNAIERIRRYNPSAKLIMCLRHPAHRAYSHWRMETQRGFETMSFAEATSTIGRQRVSTSPSGVHRVFSYVERGFYSEQIKRTLSIFPRRQVHFLRTDHLWNHPDHTLRHLMSFLGVHSAEQHCPRMFGPRGAALMPAVPAPTPKELAGLTALYAEDIQRTEAMTGVPLSDWMDSGYREPMAS